VFGLTADEARYHCDMAYIEIALAEHVQCGYNVADPVAHGVVEMSLGDQEENMRNGFRMEPYHRALHKDETA
jgi:hypothetical protein